MGYESICATIKMDVASKTHATNGQKMTTVWPGNPADHEHGSVISFVQPNRNMASRRMFLKVCLCLLLPLVLLKLLARHGQVGGVTKQQSHQTEEQRLLQLRVAQAYHLDNLGGHVL